MFHNSIHASVEEIYRAMINDYSIGRRVLGEKVFTNSLSVSDLVILYKSVCDFIEKMESEQVETYIRKTNKGIKVTLYLDGRVLHQTVFHAKPANSKILELKEYINNEYMTILEKIRNRKKVGFSA